MSAELVLPEPLVAADVDLRAMPWFPLHHKRLRRSAWWMRASDQAKVMNLELWCESMEQVPAGSLPNDDLYLAGMLGFGRRHIESWLAVKAEILGPWTLCSDGRWYHPTMAELVVETWSLSTRRREAWARKKRAQRTKDASSDGTDENVPGGQGESLPGANPLTGHDTDIDKKRKDSKSLGPVKAKPAAKKPKADAPPGATPGDRRGTRLPITWMPDDDDRGYAMSKGIEPDQIDEIAEVFLNYWRAKPGKDGTKLDWPATWKNWIIRESKRRDDGGARGGGSRGPVGSGGGSGRGVARDNVRAGFVEAVIRRGGSR